MTQYQKTLESTKIVTRIPRNVEIIGIRVFIKWTLSTLPSPTLPQTAQQFVILL